jgi:hypothetical protein
MATRLLSSPPRLQPNFFPLHASNDPEDPLETILNRQMDGNPPQLPAKLVGSYQRHPAPQIILVITSFASASAPESPITPSPSSASTQPSLRAARRTKWQKVDNVLHTYGFLNLGDFLACLFHPHIRGEKDYRTQHHRQAVGAF